MKRAGLRLWWGLMSTTLSPCSTSLLSYFAPMVKGQHNFSAFAQTVSRAHHHLKDMRSLDVALLRDPLMKLLICQSYHC